MEGHSVMHRVNMGTGLTSAEPAEKGMLQGTKEVFEEGPPHQGSHLDQQPASPRDTCKGSSGVPSPSLLD